MHSRPIPQLLNAIEENEVSRLLTGRTHCLQEKHDGRRLMVRKQGDEITGINRRGLVVAIPESIREAASQIPCDYLIDGEAVGDTLHAFDLLEVKGKDFRQRRYLDRFAGLIMIIPPGLDALRWVSTAVGTQPLPTQRHRLPARMKPLSRRHKNASLQDPRRKRRVVAQV